MFNNTISWFTDIFSVYRQTKVEKYGITTYDRVLISKDNKGRIYRKSSPSLQNKETASELHITDKLICDINIDIEAGDEIRVLRGYLIGKNTKEKADIYIAGLPSDYYMPVGGINVDLEHKEVELQNTLRSGAYV